MLKFGAYDANENIVKKIQNENVDKVEVCDEGETKLMDYAPKSLSRFAEIEVRLRLCKLLGVFDLSCY